MTEEVQEKKRRGRNNADFEEVKTEGVETKSTEIKEVSEEAEAENPSGDIPEVSDGLLYKEPSIDSLSSPEINAETAFALGGVEYGLFPFSVIAENNTESDLSFGEVAAYLKAYSQNNIITFLNRGELDTFICNIQYYTELWAWGEHYGIILKPLKEEVE